MKNLSKYTLILLAIFTLQACDFDMLGSKVGADNEFGDQKFKTSIALIELHKTRYGEYPESLEDIKYIGSWDELQLNGVEYKKLDKGYSLIVTRGWAGKPDLEYPDDFFQGLGIKMDMKEKEIKQQ